LLIAMEEAEVTRDVERFSFILLRHLLHLASRLSSAHAASSSSFFLSQ
jgi:hypothetical protein